MLQITIRDTEVRRMLDRTEKAISVASLKTWSETKADPYMREQFRKSFDTETAPSGKKWARLAASTIRKEGDHPILRNKGGLMRSVTQKRGEVRVFAGMGGKEINMAWGHNIKLPVSGGYDKFQIHQLGAPRKNIPARPMIGFRWEDNTHLVRSLAQWIRRQGI